MAPEEGGFCRISPLRGSSLAMLPSRQRTWQKRSKVGAGTTAIQALRSRAGSDFLREWHGSPAIEACILFFMSARFPMTRIRLFAACTLLAVWSYAMATEEPSYTVVRSYDSFEVRQYEAYIVAETLAQGAADEAGSQGFKVLAGYIFGGNKGARKIAMTAPVAQTPTRIAMTAPVLQSASDGAFVIQFAMPREWTLETLPEPTNASVRLRAMPARTLAVIGYSGTWSQSRYEEHLKKLQDGLVQAGLSSQGDPFWARYDPPWTPWFLRRNEIWLTLK